LVALDMDGTLLRDDKTVAEVDARAIADARRRGVAVTLATGRLVSGALPFARALGLDTPLICADGGLIVDAASGRALHRIAIEPELANAALASLDHHALVPFVFLEDTIHTVPAGAPLTGLVRTWSEEVVAHPSVEAFHAGCSSRPVALTVGVGREEDVLRCADDLARAHGSGLETVVFAFGGEDRWAVRSLPAGCDKGFALRSLADRLGVAMERTAVVGDWLNDLGMFRAAGRSFAMGQAPEEVKRAATDRLRATSATGGGIAEALAALLDG
jgi:Cof subfamily protein (haloacid dehalogenase superfamily)